jgi:hypothetical protein
MAQQTISVTGSVLTPAGLPLAGATVVGTSMFAHYEHTLTDAAGVFALTLTCDDALLSERYVGQVNVYHPGYAVKGQILRAQEVVIQLEAAGSVEGSVVDLVGRPLAGVAVALCGYCPPQQTHAMGILEPLRSLFTTLTTAEGYWRLEGVTPVGAVTVTVADPRYVADPLQISRDHGTALPALVVESAAMIAGRVLDQAGLPAGGIIVTAKRPSRPDFARAVTDADGRYLLGGLHTGPVTIFFTDPHDQGVARPLEEVPACVGETVTVPEARLTPGGVITGQVLERETGQPVAGITVRCQGPFRWPYLCPDRDATTDDTGTYRLRVVAGKNTLFLTETPDPYITSDRRFVHRVRDGQEKRQDIRVARGQTLAGRLVDDAGGPMVERICLRLEELRGGDVRIAKQILSASDGQFTFQGVHPGRYAIATADPHRRAWAIVSPAEVTVPLRGSLTLAVHHVRSRPPLIGRVCTVDGTPIPGALVEVDIRGKGYGRLDWGCTRKLVSDMQGCISLDGVTTLETVAFARAEKPGYQVVAGGEVTQIGGHLALTDIVLAPK